MKFELTISIQPSAPFGVPQEGTIVVPGKPGNIIGPTLHFASGETVGYGTLPQYRMDDQAINLMFSIGKCNIQLHDNYGFVKVEADSPNEAYELATKTLDRLLRHLSLSNGILFSFQPLIFESEDSKLYPVPKYLQLTRLTMYNLESLTSQIQEAARLSALEDEKLLKAIEYFEQALLLFQHRDKIADVLSRHHALLIAAAFLNLWKAVSVIVGDPNVDSDYQSRYRTLGFDYDFFQNKIEKVRELRNNYDVAHYSLDPQDIKQVEENFGAAQKIAMDVLQQYRSRLTPAA